MLSIILGVGGLIVGLVFGFIGNRAIRGLRRSTKDSLSTDEQLSLLTERMLLLLKQGTLDDAAQRRLAKEFSTDILTDEMVQRTRSGRLRAEEQSSLAGAFRDSVLSKEAGRRIKEQSFFDTRSLVELAPRSILVAVFSRLDLSVNDLTPYELKQLAKLFSLDRLIAMMVTLGVNDLSDKALKKLADLLGLDRLLTMILVRIDTLMEQSISRFNRIDERLMELEEGLLQSRERVVELRSRFDARVQEDSGLPEELYFVDLASVDADEIERLREMIFTDKQREELLSVLLTTMTTISQGNEEYATLEQQRAAEDREQNGLRQLRSSVISSLRGVIADNGTDEQ